MSEDAPPYASPPALADTATSASDAVEISIETGFAREVHARLAKDEPERAATLLPGATLGRYVIVAFVGEGGMGSVYAAYDPQLDRKVALKLLRAAEATDAARVRLLREAQALARVAHPHIVAVHDAGELDGRVFLTMEFVDGASLRQWLSGRAARKRRTWREIVRVFLEAGEGLAALHEAGLVHRDFKPDNVLVGKDGRARVADFGLARATNVQEVAAEEHPLQSSRSSDEPRKFGDRVGTFPAPSTSPSEPRARLLGAELTLAGAVAGTPAYMAPEQFRGETPTVASDQFSFCVALYEALYGQRPFAHRLAGAPFVLGSAPSDRGVPARLRRILVRGLSADEGMRFPSMRALLSALSRDPRRRFVWGAVLVVVLGLGGLSAAQWLGGRAQARAACAHVSAGLVGVWDPLRRGALERAFEATHKAFAPTMLANVTREIDAYTQRWTTLGEEACVATRVRRERSEESFSAQNACLARRRAELRALVDVLAVADAQVVERSLRAVQALTPVAACGELATSGEASRAQRSPEDEARVEGVRALVAQAKAAHDTGGYAAALPLATEAVAQARLAAHRALEAEALLLRGDLEARLGDGKAAEETLFAALCAAEATRDDRLALRAASGLVWVTGSKLRRIVDAERWTRLGRALLEPLGREPALETTLETVAGAALSVAGHHKEALARHEVALRAAEQLGPESPFLPATLSELATTLFHLGRFAEARVAQRRALDLRERTLGPAHPDVAVSLNNLANLDESLGDYAGALAALGRARAIFEAALGPEHERVASVVNNQSVLLVRAGLFEKAATEARRARVLYARLNGPEHADVAMTHYNEAVALERMGQLAPALERLRASRVAYRAALGPTHVDLAQPLHFEGRVLLRLGRAREALASFEAALSLRESAQGTAHTEVAEALTGVGEARLALREAAGAREVLERALGIHDKASGDPSDRARTELALAEALRTTESDRSRTLAEKAREAFVKGGPQFAREAGLAAKLAAP